MKVAKHASHKVNKGCDSKGGNWLSFTHCFMKEREEVKTTARTAGD